MNNTKSKELYEKGQKHLVGAVNSPVRAFNSVGGNPLFMEKAHGSKIYDASGLTLLQGTDEIIAEPLKTHYPKITNNKIKYEVKEMMVKVGLLPNLINRYPHEFSGGQC